MVNFNDKDNKHTRLYLFSVVLYDIAISSEVRYEGKYLTIDIRCSRCSGRVNEALQSDTRFSAQASFGKLS